MEPGDDECQTFLELAPRYPNNDFKHVGGYVVDDQLGPIERVVAPELQVSIPFGDSANEITRWWNQMRRDQRVTFDYILCTRSDTGATYNRPADGLDTRFL